MHFNNLKYSSMGKPKQVEPPSAQPIAATVSVKLPPFYTEDPDGWFLQAEAQFEIRGISQDSTRYWHLAASLDASTASRAARVTKRYAGTLKYQHLKDWLLKTFGFSKFERAERILAVTGLGDRKPSELADYLLRTLGDHSPRILLQHILLRSLPQHVQDSLATTEVEDLEGLADAADEVMSRPRKSDSVYLTQQEISDEREAVHRVESRPKDDLCYFHRRFGKAARQCRPPCSWKSGNAGAAPQRF